MRQAIQNHKKATAAGVIAVIVIGAVLAFGVFGIQTAFLNKTVSEAGPTFTSTASPTSAGAEAPASTPADGGVTTLGKGSFKGADASHSVEGEAQVLTNGTDQRFLRLMNFKATNGPDLKIYLRAANDEYVSLGDLKGNVGDQNYEIPASVDLDKYTTVQIWCERFGVNFGQATLA